MVKVNQEQATVTDSSLKILPRTQRSRTIETCPKCGCKYDKTAARPNGLDVTYCKECGLVSSSAAGEITNTARCLKGSEVHSDYHPKDVKMTFLHGVEQQNYNNISLAWLKCAKASDQTEKNFALTLAEITKIVHALSIGTEQATKAAEVCKQAFEKGLSRGNSLSVLAAALVYASARMALIPITIEEVAAKSGLTKSDIARCFRKLQRQIGLVLASPSPQAFASKIFNLLSLQPDGEMAAIASGILAKAERNGVTQGRNPAAVAAAAIYAASLRTPKSNNTFTQRKLAQVASVTETTIRRVCQSLDL